MNFNENKWAYTPKMSILSCIFIVLKWNKMNGKIAHWWIHKQTHKCLPNTYLGIILETDLPTWTICICLSNITWNGNILQNVSVDIKPSAIDVVKKTKRNEGNKKSSLQKAAAAAATMMMAMVVAAAGDKRRMYENKGNDTEKTNAAESTKEKEKRNKKQKETEYIYWKMKWKMYMRTLKSTSTENVNFHFPNSHSNNNNSKSTWIYSLILMWKRLNYVDSWMWSWMKNWVKLGKIFIEHYDSISNANWSRKTAGCLSTVSACGWHTYQTDDSNKWNNYSDIEMGLRA